MRVVRGVALVAAAVIVLGAAVEARAGYIDLIGYPELKAELGASVPTGAGVKVMQVEGKNESGYYMPNTASAEFFGKTITNATGTPTGTSSHAHQVGLNFYGNSISVAPGITNITVYEKNNWQGTGFLNFGVPGTAPKYSTCRIANHSWASDTGTLSVNANILRRLDYLVETDDFLQVVAVNNILVPDDTNKPLLADSYNAIAVGVTSGAHATGTTTVDNTYVAGRTKPDVVAPGESPQNASIRTSWAAPMVSASAALLVETGHTQTGLSNGSYTSPRTGLTIYHAETSEVVKAALMAGADRATSNGRGAEITDYTVDTANGLDSRFGAGQVNVYNSYHVLTGGEHNSAQDGNATAIGRYGFDYDPAFGGLSASNTTGSYSFTADFASLARELFATLVWNIDISAKGGDPVGTATRYNLDLLLYDETADGLLAASSTSTLDNTETIWKKLVDGHSYRLDVVRGSGQGDFLWDYGLAWRMVPEPPLPGDANLDHVVDALDYVVVSNNYGTGSTWIEGDVNGDGAVNALDFVVISNNYGAHAPEPATLAMLGLGGLGLVLGRKRR
ncbi:MAG TPA: dockerin type I domain-containing protein [Phycisphaerae bacterium]|nr:dockerin type I domain-containing protein [Phycisphaerae bacterium]